MGQVDYSGKSPEQERQMIIDDLAALLDEVELGTCNRGQGFHYSMRFEVVI